VKQIRKRLTYANVMSSIAVFLVLGGATALAASQLAKNSVGTKQLKKNAVTAAKIKKNAVTTAKIKNAAVTGNKIAANAVTGEKIADGSVTGSDINAPSTPFSQIVARLRTGAQMSFEAAEPLYPIGTYTQQAGEDDQYLAGVDVNFAASCEKPRSAVVLLLADTSSLSEFTPGKLLGIAFVEDEGTGSVTKRLEFAPFIEGGPMSKLAPSVATAHSMSALLAKGECNAGNGVTATSGLVDVIGTK
jgi:hypothetical protein